MSAAGLYDRLRRPEYTGANRCLPCTVVNLLVALVAAAGIAVLADPRYAVALGVAAFLLFAGAIAVRGYLVPGTPWLTRTYLPDPLLRRFDKQPGPGRGPGGVRTSGASADQSGAREGLDVEAALVGSGLVAECDDRDDLCLAPDVRSAWRERIEGLRREDTSREDLADVLGVDVDQLTFTEHGEALVAHRYARPVGQWESHAAFLADVTAARVLDGRVDGWEGLDVAERGRLLAGLRLFIEECPSCDGEVAFGEEEVTSCCRSFDVAAATCTDCGARLFEAELGASA